jgi:predicted nucleotidyltransferase
MATVKLTPDFKEFVKLLNDHGVEYLLVGGYAVNFYGYVRYTGDFDIWVAVNPDNAEKLSTVLQDFGFGADEVSKKTLLREEKILQLGIPPFRIDILMSVSGLEFPSCYTRRVVERIDGVVINVISLEDLKTNKRASGRPKDLSDLDYFSRKS